MGSLNSKPKAKRVLIRGGRDFDDKLKITLSGLQGSILFVIPILQSFRECISLIFFDIPRLSHVFPEGYFM